MLVDRTRQVRLVGLTEQVFKRKCDERTLRRRNECEGFIDGRALGRRRFDIGRGDAGLLERAPQFSAVACALFLRRFTDTDVPWWDAFPTAASVVGQWLLGRKYVENWPVWIAVDVVGAALFAYKGLWLTTLLYGVFVAMAAVGWRRWALRTMAVAPTP